MRFGSMFAAVAAAAFVSVTAAHAEVIFNAAQFDVDGDLEVYGRDGDMGQDVESKAIDVSAIQDIVRTVALFTSSSHDGIVSGDAAAQLTGTATFAGPSEGAFDISGSYAFDLYQEEAQGLLLPYGELSYEFFLTRRSRLIVRWNNPLLLLVNDQPGDGTVFNYDHYLKGSGSVSINLNRGFAALNLIAPGDPVIRANGLGTASGSIDSRYRFSLTELPEPNAWLLFILGFSATGTALRGRTKATA